MTAIEIHDEHCRRALEYALWERGSEIVGAETLYEYMWAAGWELIGVDTPKEVPSAREADERLEQLRISRADVDLVRAAKLGAVAELGTPAEGIVYGLKRCQEAVEEDPAQNFFDKPAAVRDEMLATRDAAVLLIEVLAVPEAVT